MSIISNFDLHTPVCDVCGNKLHYEHDFHDAIAAKKADGWKSRKDKSGEWEDVCSECLGGKQYDGKRDC